MELEPNSAAYVASIVASYVANNYIEVDELPILIAKTKMALLGNANANANPEPEKLTPAVPVKKSVTADLVYCLECGQENKMLKRHLHAHHNLTPETYRSRWGLPGSYPMVAPSYALRRSELAKESGLGRKPIPAKAPRAKGRKAA